MDRSFSPGRVYCIIKRQSVLKDRENKHTDLLTKIYNIVLFRVLPNVRHVKGNRVSKPRCGHSQSTLARTGTIPRERSRIGHVQNLRSSKGESPLGSSKTAPWTRLLHQNMNKPNTSKFSTAMPCIAEISTSPRCGVYTLDSLVYFLY